jgi:aspartate ammonia-lyase
MANVRMEHDFLGDREVPADAYYGVQTLRGSENFPIMGSRSTPPSSARWGS